MTQNIRPLYDKILVKRTETEQKTAGGIFIPDTAQEKTYWGTVVAVGQGRIAGDGTCQPLQVQAGDKIIFGQYTGTEFNYDDQDFLIIREDDILGIINE